MSLAAENAEVLESVAANGTDLSIPRMIDFAHLLYSELAASEFKQAAAKARYRIRMDIFPASELDGQEGAWDVVASSTMIPTVEQVTRCEAELDALARSFGGHADGWGFESS